MSGLYWHVGAVLIVLLALALALRRKRVADEVRLFLLPFKATAFAMHMESNGYDCSVRRRSYFDGEYGQAIEVRCYRRKERKP